MQMSRKNYKILTKFYREAVENATDEEMNIIFCAISLGFKYLKKEREEQELKEKEKNDYKA